VVVLAAVTPFHVTDPWKAAGAVAAVVLLNATLCMTMYVRAVNNHGAAAVAMLFAVIPAVAGLLSWLMLGQRPDVGIAVGLVIGAAACWLNGAFGSSRKRSSPKRLRQQRQDDPGRDGGWQHGVDPVHQSPVTR
jgi:drug/metabolite transporter (DMT)-like permease